MESYTYIDGQHPQKPNNYKWFKNVFGFEEGGVEGKYITDMKKIENFHTDSPVNTNLEVNKG